MENNKKITLDIFVIFSGFGRNFWLRKRLQRDFITVNGVYSYKNYAFGHEELLKQKTELRGKD